MTIFIMNYSPYHTLSTNYVHHLLHHHLHYCVILLMSCASAVRCRSYLHLHQILPTTTIFLLLIFIILLLLILLHNGARYKYNNIINYYIMVVSYSNSDFFFN